MEKTRAPVNEVMCNEMLEKGPHFRASMKLDLKLDGFKRISEQS